MDRKPTVNQCCRFFYFMVDWFKAMWYVYILECKDKSLYAGITNNLERRFKEHHKKTTHYTSYNPPVKIVFKELYPTKPQALKREAQIKKWTRKKKLTLIEGNPQLLKRL